MGNFFTTKKTCKTRMKKIKRKIYRKYEDYFNPEDLIVEDMPKPLNISISDFNARGELANPPAPCVVTSIDPDYIKDASRQRVCRKFRMKTDILRLREITRNKFMYYATQEMFLDKKREMEYQNSLYDEAVEFHKLVDESLKKMEGNSFRDMLKTQKQFEKLKESKIAEELNEVKLEHQRILMEVQEVYGKFKYLLKLISYFDDTIEQPHTEDKLTMPSQIIGLVISEKNPAGLNEVKQVHNYMDSIVRPYLAKRNHLNAEIWIKGYERNRMKVSNYNRRFTHLALLNHIVSILYEKSQKTYNRWTIQPIFLKDPEFMKARVLGLQKCSKELFDDFEYQYKKDKVNIKLKGIVPVILNDILREEQTEDVKQVKQERSKSPSQVKQWRTIEDVQREEDSKTTTGYEDDKETILAKVEKIQAYVLDLLSKLDNVPQSELNAIENRVRRRLQNEKEVSRRALVKQNRLNNWIEHFKKHHRLQQAQRQKHKH